MSKYYIMKKPTNNENLKRLILKILEHRYSCAHEIMQMLKDEETDFEKKTLLPNSFEFAAKKLFMHKLVKE
jgi:hypothetical protein